MTQTKRRVLIKQHIPQLNYHYAIFRQRTIFEKGGMIELGQRLVLESGPDPVEAIKARIEKLEMEQKEGGGDWRSRGVAIRELKWALAAIGEE